MGCMLGIKSCKKGAGGEGIGNGAASNPANKLKNGAPKNPMAKEHYTNDETFTQDELDEMDAEDVEDDGTQEINDSGLDMDEVLNAAKQDALEDDWACMKEPPWSNDGLPGVRYGASIEIRPLTVVLPCPCAGGTWNPPHEDDGGRLDWTGLWHEPSEGHGTTAGLKKPKLGMMAYPPEIEPEHRATLLRDFEEKREHEERVKDGHPVRPGEMDHAVAGDHLVVRETGQVDHLPPANKRQFLGLPLHSGGPQSMYQESHVERKKPIGVHRAALMASAARKRLLTAKRPRAVKQSSSVGDTALNSQRAKPSGRQSSRHNLRQNGKPRSMVASINVAPEGEPPKMTSFVISGDALEKYYPGGEPYSIDFGCAKGNMRDVMTRKWKPGLRWKDVPGWTAVVVPTPCPCALGVFTKAMTPPVNYQPPTPDSMLVDPDLGGLSNTNAPPWQGPNSTKLASMAYAAVLLALVSTHVREDLQRDAKQISEADIISAVRRPVSRTRAAHDLSSFL